MLAVGEHAIEGFDPSLVRVANAFAGGLGRTRDDLCGALAGGVIVIGLLYGREAAGEKDDFSLEVAQRWRRAFVERFGTNLCRPIYDGVRLPGGAGSCAPVAGEAAAMLAAILDEAEQERRSAQAP